MAATLIVLTFQAEMIYWGMGKGKPTRKYRALREIGKVSVNFGNLTFASLVLGTIIMGEYNRFSLLLFGGGFALVFIALGIIILTIAGGKK